MLKKKSTALLSLLLVLGLTAAACGGDDADDATGTDDDHEHRPLATAPPTSRATSSSPARPPSSPSPPLSARSCSTAPASALRSTAPAPATASSCSAPARPTSPTPPAPIKDEEAPTCADDGVEFIELKIAFDGISVLTNPANDTRVPELRGPLRARRPGVRRLRQVDRRPGPRHRARFHDEAARRRPQHHRLRAPSPAPTTASSRSSSRTSPRHAPRPARSPRTRSPPARNDYASQADDSAIISAIEADDAPLGWVGFAFAEEAGDQVKELSVSKEPGGECVAPTADDHR